MFKSQQINIPKVLQELVLEELHRTHIGITKLKQLARLYVYSKVIDRDIGRLSRTCQACILTN